jgi:hypothetical protein
MGGQTDADDFHKALFDERSLAEHFRDAGLTDIGKMGFRRDGLQPPAGFAQPARGQAGGDAAGQLQGCRRHVDAAAGLHRQFYVRAERAHKLGIEVRPFTGAFWGQCLERGIESLSPKASMPS